MPIWLRRILWVIGGLVALMAAAVVAVYFAGKPLAAWAEKQINKNLKGYHVKISRISLDPLRLGLELQGLTLVQDKHPDPPVADVPNIDLGLHWGALLRGQVVGHVTLTRPVLHVDLAHLREEAADEQKIQERGWQQALESVYPLKIDVLKVQEGELTYIDKDPERPVRVTGIALEANDIRNRASAKNTFPSTFNLRADVFDSGKVSIRGRADFLAEPLPAISAGEVRVENVALNPLAPVLERQGLFLKSGVVDAAGQVEYTPDVKTAHLQNVRLHDLKVDYVHTAAKKPQEEKAAQKTKQKAAQVSNNPEFQLRVDHVQIQGNAGLVNREADPSYRVFMSNTDLRIENLSNHFSQGPAKLNLAGEFMGSGDTKITGTFRPEDNGPDFNLDVKIEGTQMKAMNDLLRAYGNFDVKSGTFTLYSELRVKNDAVEGYVKPLFKDLDVYDRRQDAEKSLFRKAYEGLVGGISGLLERRPEERVAARTELSGPVENPQADTWQLVVTLVQNAFFRAILPGFDQEISGEG